MQQIHKIIALTSLTAIIGCTEIPDSAYLNRGGPESLLDVSRERVSISTLSPSAMDEMLNWLNEDQPSAIEIGCMEATESCQKAMDIVEQFGVPVEYGDPTANTVTLLYERIIARDCDNRFISNHINPYNLSHPAFGCSLAANSLQMISDKKQITSPALSDQPDGAKAVQVINSIHMEKPVLNEFEEKFSTSGGGGS